MDCTKDFISLDEEIYESFHHIILDQQDSEMSDKSMSYLFNNFGGVKSYDHHDSVISSKIMIYDFEYFGGVKSYDHQDFVISGKSMNYYFACLLKNIGGKTQHILGRFICQNFDDRLKMVERNWTYINIPIIVLWFLQKQNMFHLLLLYSKFKWLFNSDRAITWKHHSEIVDLLCVQKIGVETVGDYYSKLIECYSEPVTDSDEVEKFSGNYDKNFIDIQTKTEKCANDPKRNIGTYNDNERTVDLTCISKTYNDDDHGIVDKNNDHNDDHNDNDIDNTSNKIDKFDIDNNPKIKVTACDSSVSEDSETIVRCNDTTANDPRCNRMSESHLTDSVPVSDENTDKGNSIKEIIRSQTTPTEPQPPRLEEITAAPVFRPNDPDQPNSRENNDPLSEVQADSVSTITQNTADSVSTSRFSRFRGEMTHSGTRSNDSDLTTDTPGSILRSQSMEQIRRDIHGSMQGMQSQSMGQIDRNTHGSIQGMHSQSVEQIDRNTHGSIQGMHSQSVEQIVRDIQSSIQGIFSQSMEQTRSSPSPTHDPNSTQSGVMHSLPGQARTQESRLTEQCSTQLGANSFKPEEACSSEITPKSKNSSGLVNGKSETIAIPIDKKMPHSSDSNTTVSQPEVNRHTQPEGDQLSAVNRPQVSFEPLGKIIHKLSMGERVPPQVSMRYEMLRLYTFHTYPRENKPFIIRFAQAGFYYANSGDEVVCYCCGRRRSLWDELDNPWAVHQRLNPNCKFLLKNDEVNVKIFHGPQNGRVSLESNSRSSTVTSLTGSDNSFRNGRASSGEVTHVISQPTPENSKLTTTTSNPNAFGNRPVSYGGFAAADPQTIQPQSSASTSTNTSRPVTESTSERLHREGKCKFPKYIEPSQRRASFQECRDICIPIDSLVESGLFYTGYGDCCRCHICGIGLRHWSVSDDPWIEHARWSRNCEYVKNERGQEFIDLVHMAVGFTRDNDEETSNEGSNVPSESNNVIDSLMHESPAQSLLEMGYSTTIIRRALRSVFDEKGRAGITAEALAEKVLMLENQQMESENATEASTSAGAGAQSDNAGAQSANAGAQSASAGAQSANAGAQSASAGAQSANAGAQSASTGAQSASAGAQSGNTSIPTDRESQLREQKRLARENAMLRNQSICTICKKESVCIVFLPCGHLVTCEPCAATVKHCNLPGCGKFIKGTVRTYLA